jgi:hypothetical protein
MSSRSSHTAHTAECCCCGLQNLQKRHDPNELMLRPDSWQTLQENQTLLISMGKIGKIHEKPMISYWCSHQSIGFLGPTASVSKKIKKPTTLLEFSEISGAGLLGDHHWNLIDDDLSKLWVNRAYVRMRYRYRYKYKYRYRYKYKYRYRYRSREPKQSICNATPCVKIT